MSALIGAFFVQVPMQASASSTMFSNLNQAESMELILRSNSAVGILMQAPEDTGVSEVRLQMGTTYSSSPTTIKARFYTSVNDKSSALLGELSHSAYDSDANVRTFSGSVDVPSGDFWLIFQCDFCANNSVSLTSSTTKTGAWTHLQDSPADPAKPFLFTQSYASGSGLTATNSNFAWNQAPLFEVTGSPTADTTVPTLASSTPTDGATGVLPNADIVLNFDENVAVGTGNISIVRTDDDVYQDIDVTSGAVTVAGSTVTVNPGTDLDLSTAYHVLIDPTAIVDTADTPNAFYGIGTGTVLNFTTITPPAVASSTPSDDSTGVNNTANIVLNFDRNVTAQSGKNITLVNTSDASDNRVIAADDSQVTVSASAVTINPTNDLKINSNYAVIFDAGAFEDGNSIPVDTLSDQTTLNFTTAPFSFNGLTVALDANDSSSYGGSGTTWADLSGSGNDVTLVNSPTFVNNGTDPKAFSFVSANSQRGDFAGTDLMNDSAYTKLVWFKPTAFSNKNNLFSSDNDAHAFWGGGTKAECNQGDGDNLAAGQNGLWTVVQADTCLETEWQLAAVTFDSTGDGMKLYRNGVVVGSSSYTTTISAGGNTGYKSYIGLHGTTSYYDGEIAQVYLYDRALSSSEINDLYEGTAGTFGLNLNTVTLNPNGGTVAYTSLRTNAGDGTVELIAPTKSNATFLGWYTASTGGTKVGDAGDTYDPDGNDITLFAQWDHTYTVTYSAGTNATGAPASVQFTESTGPVTLPTPSRDDYEFNGWYTESTGGTKVGDEGDNYTATTDVTLHGRWTQLSLAGIDPADLTLVNSDTIVSGVASSTTRSIGSSSVTLNVPADAFDPGVVVRLYSVANHDKAQAVLTNESDFVNSMVVAWTATDTTVPVANSDLTMVITDANIKAGAKVYSILGDQSTLLATATEDGTVTIAFETDPLVTIANPAPEPEDNSGGGGSGGGGGGGTPAPVTTTVPTVPTLDEDQVIEIDENTEATVLLTGTNLDLIDSVMHGDTELSFEVSESAEQITLTIPSSIAGEMNLQFMFGDEMLEQSIMVTEVIDPSVVNAGTFKGVVAIYAKNFEGKRLSAKVGEDWVIVDSLDSRFVRILERVRWVGYDLAVRIFIDRKHVRTVDLVTE